ncbi:metallophosphoesterase family protein [Oceanicola sp. S124]|uniref:metallophosphoesterase family protein n=1 Tax=Oceanicola sp. S124 TaxID=1042378 RepID=UPI0002558299|nr:metallophosphoesterase family protein [Oceanicola sp. S124]
MTLYAIGDIHGQIGMLDEVLAKIDADGGDTGPGGADEVIFLGDLVDRGPAARQVLERLIAGRAEGRRWTVIRGNHDTMFLRFLRNGELHDPAIKSGNGWTHHLLGGCATLESYGIATGIDRAPEDLFAEAQEKVPAEHRAFLESLPLWQQRPGLLFVHAGIRPGIALEEQAEQDLIWIREDFYAEDGPHPWLVVHGHTIVPAPTHFGNRIDIDTGAGANPAPRYLSCVAFEGTQAFVLSDRGRQPLLPSPATA